MKNPHLFSQCAISFQPSTGGSGKQSLTKLAAFAAGCEIFEITLSRGYDESNFREDLKILYNKLGIERKKVVFLFTDQHVAQEGTCPLIKLIYYSWWSHIHSFYDYL